VQTLNRLPSYKGSAVIVLRFVLQIYVTFGPHSRAANPLSRLDITAKNLVITEDHSGDDSSLSIRVHVELLGYDRVVI
jgi:hypothetical protein